MRSHKFNSIGAAQLAQMNEACRRMSRDTREKLNELRLNRRVVSVNKTQPPALPREIIARG